MGNHFALAGKSSKPVPGVTVVAFNGIGAGFANNEFFLRNHLLVGLIVIYTVGIGIKPSLYTLVQAL